MFNVDQQDRVRDQLLARARADDRITGAAITGSKARDAEDRWSDIDLFFGVAPDADVNATLEEWSAFAYHELGALHHFDLRSGPARYRAFLLADLLEIDLAFTPMDAFGPTGSGAFRVVFGEPVPRVNPPVDAGHVIGLTWHHVRHARVCIERGTAWPAEHWISAIRGQTLSLACLRLGYPSDYAKGAHLLPAQITDPLLDALVGRLDATELNRALRAVTTALLSELRATDAGLAATLEPALLACVDG